MRNSYQLKPNNDTKPLGVLSMNTGSSIISCTCICYDEHVRAENEKLLKATPPAVLKFTEVVTACETKML